MAKRKRLDPAPLSRTSPAAGETTPGMRAPIAQVTGESSTAAALTELSEAVTQARAEGRFVQELPLDKVHADHLVRDRISVDEGALVDLITSIRNRGQQAPIEVVELADGYGLISGWRRLEALRRLHEETGDEAFATVQALLRRPADAAQAYQAMVEENEIRVGLSYYERARIVVRAVDRGVYPDRRTALRELFASASRPRRSKISTFITVHDALDGVLRFPATIPERLGLRLAKALEGDPEFTARLRDALVKGGQETAEAELSFLAHMLSAPRIHRAGHEACPGIFCEMRGDRLVLSGPGVTSELRDRLLDWLRENV